MLQLDLSSVFMGNIPEQHDIPRQQNDPGSRFLTSYVVLQLQTVKARYYVRGLEFIGVDLVVKWNGISISCLR
jgi:hypothetical protein